MIRPSDRPRIAAAAPKGVLAFIVVALAACAGLFVARAPATIAPFWIANVCLLAISARAVAGHRPIILLGGFGGSLVANLLFAMGWPLALAFSAANVAEVAVACFVLGRVVGRLDRLHKLRDLSIFLIVAGLLAPLVSTLVAAAAAWALSGASPRDVAVQWFPADALGMIIVGPLLLTTGARDFASLARPLRQVEAFALVALAGLVTFAVFAQAPYPLLFLILPTLTLAAFRLQFAGTALAMATVAAIASMMTVAGNGPIAHYFSSLQKEILYLQVFLAIAVVATLPTAAVATGQARLIGRLTESEARFRRLVEAAPIAMFGILRDGTFTFANAGWLALLGVEPDELDRIDWRELVDHDAGEAIDALQRRPPGGPTASIDLRLRPIRGEPRWISLSLSPHLDESGRVFGWIGAATDIDERREAAAIVADREARYRLLAEHSNDMIVRIGLDGVRRYVSPAAERILGYPAEELLGATPIAAIHPDDRVRVERVFRSLLEGAVDPICSYRQMTNSGRYVWLEATYRLVRDADGTPAEFVASVRDIASRREAERVATAAAVRLEESNRLLLMAETLALVGHWRLDALTQVLFWSDQVFRIHGRDLADRPTLDEGVDAYHPDDRAMVADFVGRGLSEGAPWSFEARILRPDGEVRHVASQGQAERAPDGTIVGLFGVFQDITELARARDDARAAAESKSAFLATMSHEIRTPMTGVLGMIDLLRSDPAPRERERFLESLDQSANLLMTVLDDILDYSKIESGRLTLEERPFDLGEVVQTTLNLFHNAASSKGLLLTSTVPREALWLSGDATRLQQVLANLVSNAVKFTHEGAVEVRVIAGNGTRRRRVLVEVVDSGIGIAPDRIEALFEPFVQADPSTTREFGGTGLGLAIARRLVEAMNGLLLVHSVPGLGTTFRIELDLPIAREKAAPAAPAADPPARVLHILVAEDNRINQALITALLQREGHRVTCVGNGIAAVEAAAGERFDLILMDMQMPELDGRAATQAIRREGLSRDVPVYALTADASPDRRDRYDAIGLTGVLTKPINVQALRARLAATIAGDDDATGAILDHRKIDEMREVIGPTGTRRLIDLARSELEVAPLRIHSLVVSNNLVAARLEAHGLRGAAQGIGALALAEACRSIEDVNDNGPIAERVTRLSSVAERTLIEIAALA